MTALNNRKDLVGTATSPESIINKGYLLFKIAGNSSKDTRIAILVDGELERWVAGNRRLDFEDICIDLNHWKGHKLIIKVIDESKEHYLLADDFRLSDQPLERYYKNPQDFGVEPQFVQKCTFFKTADEKEAGRRLPVGLSPRQFDFAINEVYKRMIQPDMDHVRGRSIPELANLIGRGVDEVIKRFGIGNRPPLLRKWLLAEGICAWVNTHVAFDQEAVNPVTGLVNVK